MASRTHSGGDNASGVIPRNRSQNKSRAAQPTGVNPEPKAKDEVESASNEAPAPGMDKDEWARAAMWWAQDFQYEFLHVYAHFVGHENGTRYGSLSPWFTWWLGLGFNGSARGWGEEGMVEERGEGTSPES